MTDFEKIVELKKQLQELGCDVNVTTSERAKNEMRGVVSNASTDDTVDAGASYVLEAIDGKMGLRMDYSKMPEGKLLKLRRD
ncbi:MAG: hypothetical protein ABII03_00755 [Nanoarchaeota archaeon]